MPSLIFMHALLKHAKIIAMMMNSWGISFDTYYEDGTDIVNVRCIFRCESALVFINNRGFSYAFIMLWSDAVFVFKECDEV